MQTKVRFLLLILTGCFASSVLASGEDSDLDSLQQNKACEIEYEISERYQNLNDTTLSYEVFEKAFSGYLNLLKLGKLKKLDTLTIADFTQSSLKERLYLIDLKKNKIFHKSLVSHGMHSGRLIPSHFSNEDGSGKSSLGFYTIDNTYKGKFDLAVKLNGFEYSNSHAHRRGMVMHAAKYANPDFAKQNGALGRSLGCPALPEEGFKPIVDYLKGGSCLFIYSNNRSYLRRSKLINRKYYLM